MLNELVTEWENAAAAAVLIEDKMNEDGETFEFRRIMVTFRGVGVEILSKRRPNSGLAADAKADPEKGPKYLVTIFVPSTKKIIENLPTDSICPKTDKMIAILQALDVYDHDKVVEERKKETVEVIRNAKLGYWNKALAETDFTDDEKKIFTDYAMTVMGRPIVNVRGEVFINFVKNFHKQIIAKDLEACHVSLDDHFKPNHTLTDVMYNVICQCLDRMMKNDHGDYFIPKVVIENRFWNAEGELNMSTYIRAVRSILRDMYSFCHEKTATFTFVLIGLTKYYEAITGESVQLRLARSAQRKKDAKAHARNGYDKKSYNKRNSGDINSNFGSLGQFLEDSGIKF